MGQTGVGPIEARCRSPKRLKLIDRQWIIFSIPNSHSPRKSRFQLRSSRRLFGGFHQCFGNTSLREGFHSEAASTRLQWAEAVWKLRFCASGENSIPLMSAPLTSTGTPSYPQVSKSTLSIGSVNGLRCVGSLWKDVAPTRILQTLGVSKSRTPPGERTRKDSRTIHSTVSKGKCSMR